MNEGQDLLHDMIEDNSAAEGCFYYRLETGLFIKRAVREAQGVLRLSLQTRNELLLKPDCLVYSIVVTFPRQCRIFRLQRPHFPPLISFLYPLPLILKNKKHSIHM